MSPWKKLTEGEKQIGFGELVECWRHFSRSWATEYIRHQRLELRGDLNFDRS